MPLEAPVLRSEEMAVQLLGQACAAVEISPRVILNIMRCLHMALALTESQRLLGSLPRNASKQGNLFWPRRPIEVFNYRGVGSFLGQGGLLQAAQKGYGNCELLFMSTDANATSSSHAPARMNSKKSAWQIRPPRPLFITQ